MKLSIIIPVYNVENYIAECIASAYYPECKDYEIIAVNDGSTDRSGEILRECETRYSGLLKVITTENRGAGPARNTGIENAQGQYLLFMDSDDKLSENALPEILQQCEKDFDLCLFDALSVNIHGDILKYERGSHKSGSFTLEEYPQVLYEFPAPWNKIFKKTLFTENNIFFPKRVWFEDLRVCSKLYYFAKSIVYINKPWYLYLQHTGQITNSANAVRNLEIITAIDDIVDFYKSMGLYEKYRFELEYMIFYNELLTTCNRVNLIDRDSAVQDELLLYFMENCPCYRSNRYWQSMPLKYRVLNYLIIHRHRGFQHFLLKLNNLIHLKNV